MEQAVIFTRRVIMELVLALLGILSTAWALYYMGRSGFKWGENLSEVEESK